MTTDQYEIMVFPSVIPPHFSVMGEVEEIFTSLKDNWDECQQLPKILCKSLEDAIENQAAGNGHLTRHSLNQIMAAHCWKYERGRVQQTSDRFQLIEKWYIFVKGKSCADIGIYRNKRWHDARTESSREYWYNGKYTSDIKWWCKYEFM